ncbi:aspartate/glutamate racemase family protein [Bordetella genomosp. 13]|uniref:aspartate/glutamate racemase family protein n=1 Tax=Bordetella genomosp. 13 TaxID=463040 RepID=UPI0011A41AE6|nr:aspartate/glutamate racemase family protein [Bordetella genomosp. 13]
MNAATPPPKAPPRFWHQSMVELETAQPYRDYLESHARAVLGDTARVSVHGLRPGSLLGRPSTPGLSNPFVYHRVLDQVIDNAIAAQRDGCDAFVIGSFSEPYLREIRSILDIPVLSILESTLLTGCSLGQRIIPISNAPEIAAMVDRAIAAHGLGQRVLPAVALDPPLDEPTLAHAIGRPGPVLEAFTATARAWLARGADVIVPAEGVLSTVLTANAVAELDGAPVLDVFAITWRHAVMMTGLRRDLRLSVSRVGHYARGEQALVDEIIARGHREP